MASMSLQHLLQGKVSRCLVAVFFFQFFYIAFRAQVNKKTEALTVDAHQATLSALESHNETIVEDFGLMGRKVAALADLAQHYTENSVATPELNQLIVETFPWWNVSTLQYFPWKYRSSKIMDRPRSYLESVKNQVGIVISTGDANAKETAHLIRYLRKVHSCKLPIDIAYIGDTDLSPHMRTFLSKVGTNIKFIDLTQIFDNSLIELGGYASKPFAVLASRYPHTILLDADAVLFSNPSKIFTTYASLRETGLLFFHDRSILNANTPDRQVWLDAQLKQAGRQPSPYLLNSSLFYRKYIDEEADSAVVAIDKSRPGTYMAIMFACWMNTKQVREAVTYQHFLGDKDTYWIAAELAGEPYSFEPWSSARLAQEPYTDIGLSTGQVTVAPTATTALANGENSALPHFPSPEAKAESHPTRDGDINTPGRRCTTHMVHAQPDGSEPMWANGGLWLDKPNKHLGLSNWTHWYLGSRNDEAIKAFDEPPRLIGDSEANKAWVLPGYRHELREKVIQTQPRWYHQDWSEDAKGCPQHDESRWKPLSQDFRDRLNRMIGEVRKVEAAWTREFGS
jgi:hypothetical protein